MSFRRQMGAGGVMFASIGAMVGSGWLFSSLYAARLAGPAALLSWIIASFFIIIIAMTFAELGAMFPIAGGTVNYPFFTHGRAAGFLLGWISWLSFLVLTPVEVQATLQYMSNFFPTLTHQDDGGLHSLTLQGYGVATILMLCLVFINTRGVQFFEKTNRIFSIWKLIIPAIAILAFIIQGHGIQNLGFSSPEGFLPYGWHGVFSALAIAGVVFSFNGFQIGITMAAETANPQKNIPRAIIGSVLIGTVLYLSLQFAFLVAVPPQSLMTGGWKSLAFSGDAGPLAGLALLLGAGWIASILYVDAVVAPLGAGIVYAASSSRVLYALGANGYMPGVVKTLDRRGIPITSVWINFFLGMLAFLPFPGWQGMVSFLSSTMVASYAVVPVCLYVLRQQQPELSRPFRLPFYRVFCLVAFFLCNLMLYWCGWDVMIKLFIAVMGGFAIYIIKSLVSRNLKEIILEGKNPLWIFFHMTGMTLISRLGTFPGGSGFLSSGIDVIAIAILSWLVLVVAGKYSLSVQKSKENICFIVGKNAFKKEGLEEDNPSSLLEEKTS